MPAGKEPKRRRRADVRTLVRTDSPDDMEIAEEPEHGEAKSLVKIDSPDDAEVYPRQRRQK